VVAATRRCDSGGDAQAVGSIDSGIPQRTASDPPVLHIRIPRDEQEEQALM